MTVAPSACDFYKYNTSSKHILCEWNCSKESVDESLVWRRNLFERSEQEKRRVISERKISNWVITELGTRIPPACINCTSVRRDLY